VGPGLGPGLGPGQGQGLGLGLGLGLGPGRGPGRGRGLGLALALALALGLALALALGLGLGVGTVKDERVVWLEPDAGEGSPVAVPRAPHRAGGGGQREAWEGGQWLRRGGAGRGVDARVEACACARHERGQQFSLSSVSGRAPCRAASHPAESAARTRWHWRRRSGAR
jgi:hypothetical protein